MAVELVMYDIGNVLVEWHPEPFYDRAIGPERRAALFAEVDLHEMNLDIDRGADFRETIYAKAEQHPEWQNEIRMWHDNWLEMIQPVIEHSVRLLRALRAKGVPVQALTNFGVGTFELGETVYPFLREFDMRHISGHMKQIKPDPEIYAMVEARCGFAPETILFVDDRPENIAAAMARGWQGHVFDGPQGWADRLVAERLLTPEEAV